MKELTKHAHCSNNFDFGSFSFIIFYFQRSCCACVFVYKVAVAWRAPSPPELGTAYSRSWELHIADELTKHGQINLISGVLHRKCLEKNVLPLESVRVSGPISCSAIILVIFRSKISCCQWDSNFQKVWISDWKKQPFLRHYFWQIFSAAAASIEILGFVPLSPH